MSPRHPDDVLRRALRRGDPADDGRDPGAAELAAWRARALARVTGRRPAPTRRWLVPAAGAVLAAAVLVALAVRPGPAPGPPPAARQTARTDAPAAAAGTGAIPPTSAAETAAEAPDPDISSSPPAPLPGADRRAAEGAAPLAAAAGPHRRHLQFTAPGGTRIIWTLDPRFPLQSKGDAS